MPCQPIAFTIIPPAIGAMTGATPFIAPTMAKDFARLCPLNLSVAIERAITTPPAAAAPCTKRSRTKVSIFGAKMQANVDIRYKTIDIISGGLRPYLSLSGPKINCPIAKPNIEVVSPNCTIDTVVLKKVVIVGKLGRYISVTNGPKAVSRPSITNRKEEELRFIFLFFIFVVFGIFFIKNAAQINRTYVICTARWYIYIVLI